MAIRRGGTRIGFTVRRATPVKEQHPSRDVKGVQRGRAWPRRLKMPLQSRGRVRSATTRPLATPNLNRSCQTCHKRPEEDSHARPAQSIAVPHAQSALERSSNHRRNQAARNRAHGRELNRHETSSAASSSTLTHRAENLMGFNARRGRALLGGKSTYALGQVALRGAAARAAHSPPPTALLPPSCGFDQR